MNRPRYLEIEVPRFWMVVATKWAIMRVRHTIDRPRMNTRSLSERLDDIAMGEIASVAVMHHIANARGSGVVAYDCVRTDDHREPDPEWDLALGDAVRAWHPRVGEDPKVPPKDAVTMSVKASRLPRGRTLESAIRSLDFKIIAKADYIGTDLTTDFVAQVYYDLQTSVYLPHLQVTQEMIDGGDVEGVMRNLELERRYGRPYFVGTCGRDELIAHSVGLPEERRMWESPQAGHTNRLWIAPLRLATIPVAKPGVVPTRAAPCA